MFNRLSRVSTSLLNNMLPLYLLCLMIRSFIRIINSPFCNQIARTMTIEAIVTIHAKLNDGYAVAASAVVGPAYLQLQNMPSTTCSKLLNCISMRGLLIVNKATEAFPRRLNLKLDDINVFLDSIEEEVHVLCVAHLIWGKAGTWHTEITAT